VGPDGEARGAPVQPVVRIAAAHRVPLGGVVEPVLAHLDERQIDQHHQDQARKIEIYFSIVQRKVLAPNDFLDLSDVEDRLMAFQDLYNLAARPFNWKYTKNSLNDLLNRLATHDIQQRPAAA
jgi:hypothetical protein